MHLFSYKAHAMGANTVSTIEMANQASASSNVPLPAAAIKLSTPFTADGDVDDSIKSQVSKPSWNLMITSGGDDQAICICNTKLRLKDSEVSEASFDPFLVYFINFTFGF